MLKAMEFNGKKVLGMEIKLDKARSKEAAPGDRKGKYFFHVYCRLEPAVPTERSHLGVALLFSSLKQGRGCLML